MSTCKTIVDNLKWDMTTLSCQQLELGLDQTQRTLSPLKIIKYDKKLKKEVKKITMSSHQNVYNIP